VWCAWEKEMHINLIGNLGMERDYIKIGSSAGHLMSCSAGGTFTVTATVEKIPDVT
jgi:hypothetical protein